MTEKLFVGLMFFFWLLLFCCVFFFFSNHENQIFFRKSTDYQNFYLNLDSAAVAGNFQVSNTFKKFAFKVLQKCCVEFAGQVMYKFEPPRGKTSNVVSEQVRHKPRCTSTEAG